MHQKFFGSQEKMDADWYFRNITDTKFVDSDYKLHMISKSWILMEIKAREKGQKILFLETISSLFLLSISSFLGLMNIYIIF